MRMTSARRHVERFEVFGEHLREQLGQRAAELDTGRPAAGDHDAERALFDERAVPVGVLELSQHGGPNLDRVFERLERQRVLVHAGDAEVAADRARREDQVVVRDRFAVGDHDPTLVEVDADDTRHLEVRVRLAPDHAADARRDVVGRHTCGRNLVEQRREGVEVVLVDEGDVDRGLVE